VLGSAIHGIGIATAFAIAVYRFFLGVLCAAARSDVLSNGGVKRQQS